MSKTLSELKDDIELVLTNPANVQRAVLNTMESFSTNGEYDVVDPSNPFVFLLESSIALGTAGIHKDDSLIRQVYPSLAQNEEELYHHMSDVDYIDRFAIPSHVDFTFLMSVEEIVARAIYSSDGVGRMIIPEDTEVTVEGVTFTLYYAIEIRVMPHGGMQIVWDTSRVNPLHSLSTNALEWELVRMNAQVQDLAYHELVKITVPMYQFKVKTQFEQFNSSKGFNVTYSYNDQFYHCRVYVDKGDRWEEIKTTHSEQVYDPTEVTAVLKVLDNQLKLTVPQIYFNRNMLNNGLRVDIYTTQGNITTCFDRYEPRSFEAEWKYLGKQSNPLHNPIRSFNTITIYADDCATGGKNRLDFTELRDRVIYNALGPIENPITTMQLEHKSSRLGFEIESDVDSLTNRIYMATRAMEAPDSNADIISPLGITMQTLASTANQLSQLDSVYSNSQRVTVGSGTIFELKEGKLRMLTQDEVNNINNYSLDLLVQRVNEGNYLYTPFHYVYDMTGTNFEVRPYYLDDPTILNKQFMSENETTQVQVSTYQYGITKSSDGYRLAIITRSGDNFKSMDPSKVAVFLSYIPSNDNDRAYMRGTYLGKSEDDESIYEFFLKTNFDVDYKNRMTFDSFSMFSEDTIPLFAELETEFDLVYVSEEVPAENPETSDIDDYKFSMLMPELENTYGLMHEQLKIKFGTHLDGLWSRGRTVASELDYVTYESDILAYYDDYVYEIDPDTGLAKFEIIDNEVVFNVLHEPGDPVMVENDEGVVVQAVKHREGEIKLDGDGNPMPVGNRKLKREVDLLLFEAPFNFVTDTNSKNYVRKSIDKLVRWTTEEITKLSDSLLENTEIWFYPQSTVGDVTVYVDDGRSTIIDSEQTITVDFYLDQSRYENLELREQLTDIAIETISEALNERVVSVTQIASVILSESGEGVYDVVVGGLGGSRNYKMLTVGRGSSLLGVAKRLTLLSNNDLAVTDDVNINFIRHVN